MFSRTIHMFDDSGDAYDACQTREDIKKGDILYIPSEGVVGLADTWPLAITAKYGKLHTPADDYFQSTEAFKEDLVLEVVEFAQRLNLIVHKVFRAACPWHIRDLMALTMNLSDEDESGDATWFAFLTTNKDLAHEPFGEVLHIFLNWCQGPDWQNGEAAQEWVRTHYPE